jgi:hypothetical protein
MFDSDLYVHCTVLHTYLIKYLICTLRNDFEGDRKVVLQTRIFFLVGDPKKKLGLYYNPRFFFRSQNHFSATLKITSKGAD